MSARYIKLGIAGALALALCVCLYFVWFAYPARRARLVKRDIYAAVEQVYQQPASIERTTAFVQKLKGIDFEAAPEDVKVALKDYIEEVERGVETWKSQNDPTVFRQEIEQAAQRLKASLKHYQ